jgi:putative ABC transport system permease protein
MWNLRYAWRMLLRAPVYSAGVILTAALAIGANAAVFSVTHAVLLRSLPYRNAGQLVWIWSKQTVREKAPFNIPDFIDYREGTAVTERLSALTGWNATLAGNGVSQRIAGLKVSADLFETLGVDAVLGRTLRPSDDDAGAPRVVVLTNGFWLRRFGADPRIVGRTLVLDEEVFTVVGVLPPSFFFPIREGEFAAPLRLDSDPLKAVRNSGAGLRAIGRLKPGVSREQARGALTAIAARLKEEYPKTNAGKIAVSVLPIADEIVGNFRAALWALAGAVSGLLIIACANLANLTLARGSARATEIAARLALGATRGRMVRQLLTESLLLAVIGGAAGIFAAAAGIRALVAFAPADLPRLNEIGIDPAVLLFTLGLTIVAGIAFGLIPAFVISKADLSQVLNDGSRAASEGRERLSARRGLVAAEVAIAVMLLIVVGLFARSLVNLQAVRVGFEPGPAVAARVALPPARYADSAVIAAFQRRMTANVMAVPGVEAAGSVSVLPLSGQMARVPFTVDGQVTERDRVPVTQYRIATPGYLRAMGIPLIRGRGLEERDNETSRPVAVVNQQLANRFLSGRDPIGAHLLINDNNSGPRPVEVVGVVGDVRQIDLDGDPTMDLYVPFDQLHRDAIFFVRASMNWVVRGGKPESVRVAMQRTDPGAAIGDLVPVERSVSGVVAPRRFNLFLLAVFAAAALVLSATGIYAVLSYSVSQRAREFAIRSTLGAGRRELLLLVVRQGITPAVIGIGGGLVGAYALARAISSMFFGLGAMDPLIFVVMPLCLLLVAVAACVGPGWRASRGGLVAQR